MAKLFEQIKIKNLELKNRVVMAPMCMYQATSDGFPTSFHTLHYATRSIGGAGLIILEATAVEARGRISGNDLGLWDDKHVEGLKNLVNEIKKYGAKVGVQLAHAGRKCGVGTEKIIAPSSIEFSDQYQTPKEMSKDDILTVIEAFKIGAKRANEAQFDTIEIHGAHGYLINQFLSPLTNKRNDEYGGKLENRGRFLKEILEAVKTVWPAEKPIIVRISAEEFVSDGNHVEDLVKILNFVKNEGIDIVNVSTGGVVNYAKINAFPGYQLNYSETIKKETGLLTIGGGLVTTAEMAEEVLQNNRADLIFFGRELLRNPYFALQAADTLKVELEWPYSYKRGKK